MTKFVVGDWVRTKFPIDGTPAEFRVGSIDQRGNLVAAGGDIGFVYMAEHCEVIIPRRAYVDMQTPAERAIRHAVHMVEQLGADGRLTAAVQALQDAFEHVADWQDDQAPMISMAAPDAMRTVARHEITADMVGSEFVVSQEGIKAIHVKVGEDGKAEEIAVETRDPLKVVPLTNPQTDGAIKTLRNMLKIAETEGFTGVGVVAVNMQGYTHSAYEQGHNIALLLGATAVLQKRLLDHYQGN